MKKDPVTIAAVKIRGSRGARDAVRMLFIVIGIACFIGAFFLLRVFICSGNTDKAKLRECVVGPFNR